MLLLVAGVVLGVTVVFEVVFVVVVVLEGRVCGGAGGSGGQRGLLGYDYILRAAGVVFPHWPLGSSVT